MNKPKIGFIFDWDGVVINSSVLHEKSWFLLSKEQSMSLPHDHFRKGFGKRNAVIITEILGWTKDPSEIKGLGDRKEEIYRALAKKNGLQLVPGIAGFLNDMRKAEIPAAIGTSTDRKNLNLAFAQHGIERFFKGSVCGEDVSKGKPDPEVFLKAASLIEVCPSQCVVFEDSTHGIEAAIKGKMKAVALSTSQSEKSLLKAGANIVVQTPCDLSIELILNLFEENQKEC